MRVPALLVPIHNVSGETTLYQLRPDGPRIKDGKALKYETPLKARMALDVPPGVRAHLGNPGMPLFITEGVRKADAAASKGLCCVALLGVWNWRGTNGDGGKVALPDWESVALNGRQTYIVFDSDVMLKPEVHGALARLKGFLEQRGASVAPVYLPAGPAGAKVGLDDYLAAGRNVDELLALASPTLRDVPTDEADSPTLKKVKGQAIELEDPEPASEPVDGAALLDEIAGIVHKYVVLSPEAAYAITLWVAHTYLMDVWNVTPLLALRSPTKRCGKTTVLRIVGRLVRRALPASGVSAAAIYRLVEDHEPSLLIDEMDAAKENEDLRAVLNSGHARDLAFIIRCVGEGAAMEPRKFSTWGPKVLAHIGRLPGTLEDRAVQIEMRRKLPTEQRERVRRRQLEAQLRPVRSRIARFAQDVADELADHEPEIPAELDDRAADNWEPLLSIADAGGGRWPALARRAALVLSGERQDEEATENPGVLVLSDLKVLLDNGTLTDEGGGVSSDGACEALRRLDERPWASWGRGRDGLQPVHLAKLLRPFGLKSKQARIGSERIRQYQTGQLREAMGRYCQSRVSAVVTPVTAPDPCHVTPGGSTAVTGVTAVTGLEGRHGSEPEAELVLTFEEEINPS